MQNQRGGDGRWLAGGFWLWLVISALATGPGSAMADTSPVTCQHIIRRDPNYSIFAVTMDLADPRISVRVAKGGDGTNGSTTWVTSLLPPSEIARREHFDIAINGDFFDAINTRDKEGKNTGYIRGKLAYPVGPAMTDGEFWHHPYLARPYLEITADHRARLVEGRPHDAIDPAAREIIGGGQIIVRDGRAVVLTNKFAIVRNPRTVVGISHGGRQLTFFVVDGRQPGLSIGMTLAELSKEMLALGCDSAMNLDGGGSTTLVYHEPGSKRIVVINSPSDTKERSVADVLGVTVDAPLPELK